MECAYFLKGLNCPNCATKIEAEVGKLAGVRLSHINLLQQKLTIECESRQGLLTEIERVVHAHEPDVEIAEDLPTRVFSVQGLCCADCASHIEQELNQHASTNVLFGSQKIKVCSHLSELELLALVRNVVQKHEPDALVELQEKKETEQAANDDQWDVFSLIV